MPPKINVKQLSTSARSVPSGMTAPKIPQAQFQQLLATMQIDATQRMVDYFHGSMLYYDPGLAQKIVQRISRKVADKMSTSSGHAAIEGGKAAELIRSTISEIMDAVSKAMAAQAKGAGVSGGVLSAVEEKATELAISAFGPSTVAQATPFLSLLPDAYKAITKSYAAVEGVIKATHASRYSKVVLVGSPRAAADATALILQRKAGYLTTTAGTSLINLGSSVATVATTGISAAAEVGVKVATLIVDLIAELTMFGIELYEFSAGEKLLQTVNGFPHQLLIEDGIAEDIFPVAFNVSPILGSYMLSSAPYFNTSDFVCLTAAKGTLASVDEIERVAVGKVNPLRMYASQIIVESKIKLRHEHRSDINKVMQQAGLRHEAAEAKTLKGRAKAQLNKHIVEPLKKKWAALRAK